MPTNATDSHRIWAWNCPIDLNAVHGCVDNKLKGLLMLPVLHVAWSIAEAYHNQIVGWKNGYKLTIHAARGINILW